MMAACKRHILVLIYTYSVFIYLIFGESCVNIEINIEPSDGLVCQSGGTNQNGSPTVSCNKCINGTICNYVLYWSFDTLDNLILMEGPIPGDFNPQATGQINSAVSTNRSRNEWIDFGIHTEACMTDPVTCGTTGGAISLWIKQTSSCLGAYFTTRNTEYTRGSTIRCLGPLFLFNVAVPEGLFTVIMGQSTEWIHIALNFIGPEEGEGIIMYQNGIQIATDERKIIENFSATSRKIFIGRAYTYLDDRYTNAQMDELLFFNQQLTMAEISLLSQQAA